MPHRKLRGPVGIAACHTLVAIAILAITGCGEREFITIGTAPIGGAFRPVGDAIASTMNDNKGDNNWKVQSKGTKGSQQNIRDLDSGDLQMGMSNSAISYYAVNGKGIWKKKYDIRAVVTLAPNVGLFIAKDDSGIDGIAKLKSKRVTVGPAGAGFEMFLGPVLTAHGVRYEGDTTDFTPINDTYANAVALLQDGNADAAFLGGAIPTAAVTQACTTMDIRFIPYDEMVRTKLIKDYPFFRDITIPAKTKDGKDTYKGMTEDFKAMDVGSMHLITTAGQDEELIYQITKKIWENRKQIAEQHPAGNAINEGNAARFTGTPFHPGAIRFYEEIGIWKGQPESGGAS